MSCIPGPAYAAGQSSIAAAMATAAAYKTAVGLAIAVDNGKKAYENYKKQNEVAKRSLKLARKNQNYEKATYWGREIEFLNEFSPMAEEETVEQFGRRFSGRLIAPIADQFGKQLNQTRCNLGRYSTSENTKAVQDLLLLRSEGIVNARVAGRNKGFLEVQQRTDLNFERRTQSIALGKGLAAEAASYREAGAKGLSSAGQHYNARFQQGMGMFGQGVGQRVQAKSAQGQYDSMGETFAQYQQNGGQMPYVTGNTGFGAVASNLSNVPLHTNNNTYPMGDIAAALGGSVTVAANTAGVQDDNPNEADIGPKSLTHSGMIIWPGGGIGAVATPVWIDMYPLMHTDAYIEGMTTIV